MGQGAEAILKSMSDKQLETFQAKNMVFYHKGGLGGLRPEAETFLRS